LKIAIVGAVLITPEEEKNIRQSIKTILSSYMVKNDTTIVVSGGADGVDTIAEEIAKEFGLETEIYPAKILEWGNGHDGGFKDRNTKMAEVCDVLYCFPRIRKDKDCYHCNTSEHQAGGGCWTAKKAKEKGKLISIIQPIKG